MISPTITIRKDVLRNFITKNKIDNIKVFVHWEYDGMVDGTVYVNEERTMSAEWLIEMILDKHSLYRVEYNLNEDVIEIFHPSLSSFNIVDERFKPLKEKYRKKCKIMLLKRGLEKL